MPPNFGAAADDVGNYISNMVTRSPGLVDQPGLVYTLAQAQAKPQEAAAIGQYVNALEAQKRVTLAQSLGAKIPLTDEEKGALQGIGLDYSGVEFTQQDAINATDQRIQDDTQGMQMAARDQQGNVMLDEDGNIKVVAGPSHPATAKQGGHGWFSSFGDFFGHLGHAAGIGNSPAENVKRGADIGNQILGVVSAPLNITQQGTANLAEEAKAALYQSAGGYYINTAEGEVQKTSKLENVTPNPVTGISPAQATDMQNLGYDPNNVFSIVAYKASGLAHVDTTPLADEWDAIHKQGLFGLNGQEAVKMATEFNLDPGDFQKKIESDPTLDPAAVHNKIQVLNSPEFRTLSQRLNAKSATIGNSIANALGIDPTADVGTHGVGTAAGYARTVAGLNLAAGFLVDPVLKVFQLRTMAKAAGVGLRSWDDANGIRWALTDPANGSSAAKQVRNGWQYAIGKGEEIRAAKAAGDEVAAAKAYAEVRQATPGLVSVLPDIIGENMVISYRTIPKYLEDGTRIERMDPIFGPGNGIRSLDDAVDYLSSKAGVIRFSGGHAALQSAYMPGALSDFGVRRFKAAIAGKIAARAERRSQAANQEFRDWATADPGRAEQLVTEGMLVRMQPQVDNAVDIGSGEAIATPETLADRTAQGAQQYELSSAARGQVKYNLKAAGKPVLEEGVRIREIPVSPSRSIYVYPGYFSKTAVAERTRQVATRWTTLLPRNTIIALNDSESHEKIRAMAATYLNRGDSNLLAAQWAAGDSGTRKAIISGLLDQVGHAAGFGLTKSGKDFLDTVKARAEQYSTIGDDIIGPGGQKMALWPGQARTQWVLPSFSEMQKVASKVGLWEATMGRALTAEKTDMLMSQWKMGALMKPSTVTRNMLEGWLRTAIEGKFGQAVQASAVAHMSQSELWNRGLAQDTKKTYDELIAKGDDASLRQARTIKRANMLDTPWLGRSTPTYHLAHFAPIALAARAYRTFMGATMSPEMVEAIAKLGPSKLAEYMEGYGQQAVRADMMMGYRAEAADAQDIAKDGFGPATLRFRLHETLTRSLGRRAEKYTGKWLPAGTEGTQGADRYASALAIRANISTDVAKAVLDRIETGAPLDNVIRALDHPLTRPDAQKIGWGKHYWPDDTPGIEAAAAHTPEQIRLGKEQWAEKLVDDMRALTTGQNGVYQKELADYIRAEGKAPNTDWIVDHLTGHNRPEHVLAPERMAVAPGSDTPRGFLKSLMDMEGAGYQWMVERPLQRMTTAPIFLANYADARVKLNEYVESLVQEANIPRAAAEQFAEGLAGKQAYKQTEMLVDDPGLRTQLDIVGRNFFAFSRATQAMIRRWGTGLWQDPGRARKMMLALEASEHSGMVTRDPTTGELEFTYPGSGVMAMLLRNTLAHIPGFENIAKFPLANSLTGGVLMAVPGADAPFRMAMSPLITIPMRELYKLVPDHRSLFEEIDKVINGPIGIGKTPLEQVTPTMLRHLGQAFSQDDKNSMFASSVVGAIGALAAGGYKIPGPNATAEERQAFLDAIRTQVRTQLVMRGIFGLFLPAAPSAPGEDTPGMKPDYSFSIRGAKSLDDEFKMILSDVEGDYPRAIAIYTGLHPDKLAVTIPKSVSASNHQYLPPTIEALHWLEKNTDKVGPYKSVLAYFLPTEAQTGQFNDLSWHAQFEFGLRQKRTPDDFLKEVYIRNAEALYYPTIQDYNAQIDAAKAMSDKNAVQQIQEQKKAWKDDFLNHNPLLQAKVTAGFEDQRVEARTKLETLRKMLHASDVPDGQGGVVAGMIKAWDDYEIYKGQNGGGTTRARQNQRAAAAQLQDYMAQLVHYSPAAASLYNGIFRPLDSNLQSQAAIEQSFVDQTSADQTSSLVGQPMTTGVPQ